MNGPILIWNIRGIGNAKSMRSLNNHIRTNDVKIVCISEPKIPIDRLESIRCRLHFDNACSNLGEDAKI